MAAEVGGLLINLGLDVAQIRQDVGKAQRELSGFRNKVDRNMAKVQRSFKRATQGVQGLVAVLGAQQLGAAIGRTLSSFEEINRQARTLGASRQTIQELQFAFRQFGLEQKDVTDALATVSDRADDALGGMQSFIDDFERFGIEVDSLRGKSPGELFRTVAQGISTLESEQKQVTAAVRLFGDEVGQRLLPLLTQGADGIDKYAERARELGVIVSDELIKDSAKAAKDFRALNEVLTAKFASAVAENAESFSTLAQALTDVSVWGAKAASSLVDLAAASTAEIFGPDTQNNLQELNRLREKQNTLLEDRARLQDKIKESDEPAVTRILKRELAEVNQELERTNNRMITLGRASQKHQESMEPISVTADAPSGASGSGGDRDSDSVLLGRVGRRGRGQSSYLQDMQQIQEDAKAARKQGEELKDVQIDIQNNQVEVNQTFERTGDIVANSFRAATREGATLRGVVQGLLRDLAQMQVNKAANNIGQSLTTALSASFGTGTSSSMGTGTGSSPAMAAGRAAGGPVRQNETYMVGENGPELFSPGKSGAITPNDKMGGGDTYNIDARGADQAAIARLERTIKAVDGSIERRAVNAVGSRRQRSFRG